MGFFTKKTSKENREVAINGTFYKISIFYEKRRNSRVSITKTGINIRIANFLPKAEKEKQISKFIDWAKKTILEKGVSFAKNQKSFQDGETMKLYDKELLIEIIENEGNRVKGTIDSEKIKLSIPKIASQEKRVQYISKIISSLIAKNYKEKISIKLHKFNEQHQFGKINTIRLKNNSTNWGSCSSKNNINISIRLFLAPEWVVDYVLIHELSHLKHRNHSSSFWKEVENAYPEFLEAEKWLKKNSHFCII